MNEKRLSAIQGLKNNPGYENYKQFGLSEEEFAEIITAFNLIDHDGNGSIDKAELLEAFNALGFTAENQTVDYIIEQFDKDKTGSVSIEEFIEIMTNKITSDENKLNLKKIYDIIVKGSKNGKISYDDLDRITKDLQGKFYTFYSNLRYIINEIFLISINVSSHPKYNFLIYSYFI